MDENSFTRRNGATVKMLLIGLLALLLLIPIAMVKSLIVERQQRQNEVIEEIGAKWGQAQHLTGPILVLPYTDYIQDNKGNRHASHQNAYLLPQRLEVEARVEPQVRYRGIYQSVVYETRVSLSGRFDPALLKQVLGQHNNLEPGRAMLALGLGDLKGIRELSKARLGSSALEMSPVSFDAGLDRAIAAPVDVNAKLDFQFELTLRGSERLYLAPSGKETRLTVSSPWATPSFEGAYLPSERRVGKDGFEAQWQVLHFNRSFPQFWLSNQYSHHADDFGVAFLVAADPYQQIHRVAKYGLMFIGLTFVAFFFSEVTSGRKVHPLQYLLVGLSLCVFYTLLLAISEHSSFALAYGLSSLATVLLIAGYAKAALASGRLAGLVGAMLAILYGYLYIILQLEDYALLMGALGLFGVLAAVMYLTRRIDWYALELNG
ncbi:cell envelope integrity protein CreD [Gallaecimonas sp. GXIMD4217]|uniref:cell envelope integrity protein CreD n=1 Tax=Gallaecimonas sp. GXIMD4217 TaxID=3131927 RepID=UPI00311AD9B4